MVVKKRSHDEFKKEDRPGLTLVSKLLNVVESMKVVHSPPSGARCKE